MTAMRCQQDEVYASEVGLPTGQVFLGLPEIQRWVDDLRDTWWWPTRYAIVERVEVGPVRRGTRGSVGWYERRRFAGRIEMKRCHWNVRDVTHELAHVIAEAVHGSKSHDPWFAREYINLTYLISGEAAWRELAARFDAGGVKYTPDLTT